MSRLIPTRWSHLLGYSGVGALMRADNDLYVIKDIGHWTDAQGEPAGEVIHYVDLLRATLAIDRELRQPPMARELKQGVVEGTCVPAWRFPGWERCPACGLLHWLPWRRRRAEEAAPGPPRCSCERRPRLQQVTWVVAHPEGGLAEVPWHFLAHKDAGTAQDCRRSMEIPYLRLTRDRQTGLRWYLSCKRCEEKGRRVQTQFDPRQRLAGIDPRRQPWQEWNQSPVPENTQRAHVLEVNDARIYFPRVSAALVIPPESRIRRGSVLDLLYCNRTDRAELERCRSKLARKAVLRRLADRYACAVIEVESAWGEIESGWPLYGQSATPGEMFTREFQALTKPIPDLDDSEDFVTRHKTDAWRALTSPDDRASGQTSVSSAVDQLVAVTRLREVRIFTGFTRVTQNYEDGLRPTTGKETPNDEPIAQLVPPDLDGSAGWLPAIELYGEGIFFTLDDGMLKRWTQQPGLQTRAEILQRRFERTGMRFPDNPPLPLTPRFILLHTLAHLLIRQLETRAGYPAASIRERIYCADGADPMAGILVYVAVPDIVGSLGGLAELAEPRRFLQLLTSVFEHADWCSLDPVCTEHHGQGPSQLNLAACHACALVPEPSCAFANALLDRTFVKGDLHGDLKGPLAFADGKAYQLDWAAIADLIAGADANELKTPATPFLIVDEGQDMPPSFYQALAELGFEHFYVVADQNQQITDEHSNIRDIENALDIQPGDRIELTDNYRNCDRVARLALALCIEDLASPCAKLPKGRPCAGMPVLVDYGPSCRWSFETVIERILKLADRNPEKLIGVIAPDNHTREHWLQRLREQPVALDHARPRIVTYPAGDPGSDYRFSEGGIFVINAQSAKGLEFDIVMLADINRYRCHPENPGHLDDVKRRFYVMDSCGQMRELNFPGELAGDEQLLLVPAPLPASWIRAILFASKEERAAIRDEAADYGNVPLNAYKQLIKAKLLTGVAKGFLPPPDGVLPDRDAPSHRASAVGAAMALLFELGNRGGTVVDAGRLIDDTLDPSPETTPDSAGDPLLRALYLWVRSEPHGDSDEVQTRMLLQILNAIVDAKAQADSASDEDYCPADIQQVVLDVLESQKTHFAEPKWQEALNRLTSDLRGILGLGGDTLSEILQRHPRSFSRGLILFFYASNAMSY